MAAEQAGLWLWAWAGVGLLASVLLERALHPRPVWQRPWQAWCLHAGVLCLCHAALSLLLGRSGFAMALVLAAWLTLILVNNAKYKALREPFVFQDYEYFTDALRYPRLYIPFLGWGKFVAACAGFAAAVALGWWLEPAPLTRWQWLGQGGAIALELAVALGLLWLGQRAAADQRRGSLAVQCQPKVDLQALGLMASLWQYARLGRLLPQQLGPFAQAVQQKPQQTPAPKSQQPLAAKPAPLPDLVAVQSESFFDPRGLWPGIRPEVLAALDGLQGEAFLQGHLQVPAWGANTVRTEAAFLTGLDASSLGVHRFNPYRAIAAGWPVVGLARYLQSLGYYTLCIHPYPAGFYLREQVFPRLGFDAFVDIAAFDTASQRFGPYISDQAVAQRIEQALAQRLNPERPVFVMAITMENHGPLHLERVATGDVQQLYHQAPPPGCEDLTIYLRHLRNANAMMQRLQQFLASSARPASLCWYGDHVPIMAQVYAQLGLPSGQVPYACWANALAQAQRPGLGRTSAPQDCQAHDLALRWLGALGLVS